MAQELYLDNHSILNDFILVVSELAICTNVLVVNQSVIISKYYSCNITCLLNFNIFLLLYKSLIVLPNSLIFINK